MTRIAPSPLAYDGDRIDDAFRLYRDYDDAGGKFGDLWIRSVSADQSRLTVYGARRTADGDYTLMVINKSDRALTSRLDLTAIPASSTPG